MAETAQQKVDKDLKTLPKSVPTPKPLNYVGNPNPEVQGTRFGNLELRADLDSRMALMPIARLGYDIIERGLLDPEAGEMGGDIRAPHLIWHKFQFSIHLVDITVWCPPKCNCNEFFCSNILEGMNFIGSGLDYCTFTGDEMFISK